MFEILGSLPEDGVLTSSWEEDADKVGEKGVPWRVKP